MKIPVALYANRAEWKDVTPLEQDDGPAPVVSIQYTAKFVDIMGYFRAVVAANERSARALELTADAISVNGANYTAWHYRRLCLEALGSDLVTEMAFIDGVLASTPKNYQVWYHRRVIATRLGETEAALVCGKRELVCTRLVLEGDSKNYHAWSHRQALLLHFGSAARAPALWRGELDYVAELLAADRRNNSAWSHRWFVLSRGGPPGAARGATRKQEVAFAFDQLRAARKNESAWNYLRGWIQATDADELAALDVRARIEDLDVGEGSAVSSAGGSGAPPVPPAQGAAVPERSASAPLRALLVDVLVREAAGDHAAAPFVRALAVVEHLRTALDVVRAKYWAYYREQLLAGYVALAAPPAGSAATK